MKSFLPLVLLLLIASYSFAGARKGEIDLSSKVTSFQCNLTHSGEPYLYKLRKTRRDPGERGPKLQLVFRRNSLLHTDIRWVKDIKDFVYEKEQRTYHIYYQHDPDTLADFAFKKEGNGGIYVNDELFRIPFNCKVEGNW